MEREQMIDLIQQIRDFRGTDEDLSLLLDELKRHTFYPNLSNLIFHTEMTAEQIADTCINHKPLVI